MKRNRNPLFYECPKTSMEGRGLQRAKFYVMLLGMVMLLVMFNLSSVISTLMKNVVIQNTGLITEMPSFTANSGSATDIQAAVNQVVAAGGIGNVYIPAGTFNFVDVNASWQQVNIPPGVNIFGAPTERTSGYPEPDYGMSPNDQVVAWKTILVMPNDVYADGSRDGPHWFKCYGNGNPSRSTRFSDIELISYRHFHPESESSYQFLIGIEFRGVIDFRVDHCCFLDIAGSAIVSRDNGAASSQGVVDHNIVQNTMGRVKGPNGEYELRTVDYGVFNKPESTGTTDLQMLGAYGLRSMYVEDNYFEKWRHCVVGDSGSHNVIRHNTFQNDFGYGSIDTHENDPNVGKVTEIYNNSLIGCIGADPQHQAIWMRGGGGVIFDNYADGSYSSVLNGSDYGFAFISGPEQEWYVWNNNLTAPSEPPVWGGTTVYLYAKSGYVPYAYPHPLTLG
jgi:hypothetical protein